ncbi:MAG: HlyD family efflux transporter periplasmic adaptor subunit [Clostridia bacterium]|nr:HlyD family efflux transporter periplasmic adaptor subunit [Clostridia bacterium]
MKRIICLVVLLALVVPFSAFASTTFNGKVTATQTVAVLAPFGGTVSGVSLRKGDIIDIGDHIAQIETTRNYAPQAGTVSGIFAVEGDGAGTVSERYGAVMYIEPENRYKISASTDRSYNSSENKFISVGERVFLSCVQDGSHVGQGVVTKVEDSDESGNCKYSLEVDAGEFYMGETVAIYRRADLLAASCIGRGTILKNPAIAITGSGSVLRINVSEGEKIERGENLFETVEGTLDGLYAMDSDIISDVAGVVASIDITNGGSTSKGSAMLTVYPKDSFRIEISVSERELSEISVGDKVYIEFDWDIEGTSRCSGTVESISYVSESENSIAQYKAYISFEPTDDIRLGMSTVIYVAEETEETATNE